MENGEHYPGTSWDLLCSMSEVDGRSEAESSLINSLPFTFECSWQSPSLCTRRVCNLLAILWQIFINCWLGPCAFECLLQSIGFAISFPINCKAIQDNL